MANSNQSLLTKGLEKSSNGKTSKKLTQSKKDTSKTAKPKNSIKPFNGKDKHDAQKPMRSDGTSAGKVNNSKAIQSKGGKGDTPKSTRPSTSEKAANVRKGSDSKVVKPIRIHDEAFSWEEASFVAAIDSGKLSSDTKEKFIRNNQFQYYVALNCWDGIWNPNGIREISDVFRRWIMSVGLVTAVAECGKTADEVVTTLDLEGYDDHGNMVVQLTHGDLLGVLASGLPSVEALLDALRFLKRFTPIGADKLRAKTISDFISILNETNWGLQNSKLIDPEIIYTPRETEHFPWVTEIKNTLKYILRDFRKHYDIACCKFSNGVCSDGKNLVEKLGALSFVQSDLQDYHGYHPRQFPIQEAIRLASNKRKCKSLREGDRFITDVFSKKGEARSLFIPAVNAVPKSLKAFRIIAPESSFVSFHMQAVREALVNCMKGCKYDKLFDCTDQEPNRVAAFEASFGKDGVKLATIDLSAASDRQARHVMRYFLPTDVWEIFDLYSPIKIAVDDKLYAPSIFLTSGNPSTFMMLGIFVLSICLAGYNIHKSYSRLKKDVRLAYPLVIGDDAVVDLRTFDEVIDIFERCGLKVNYEKTFSGHYRESCGVEYVDGFPTTTEYWPRKEVKDPNLGSMPEDICTLTALQHRLFWNSRIRGFLTDLVLSEYPGMTDSEVGAECVDLWAIYPRDWIGRGRCRIKQGMTTKDLSPSIVESGCMDRRDHITVRQEKSPLWDKLSKEQKEAVEVYFYYRWLAVGPQYATPLDELLHVSTPTPVEMQAFPPVLSLVRKKG